MTSHSKAHLVIGNNKLKSAQRFQITNNGFPLISFDQWKQNLDSRSYSTLSNKIYAHSEPIDAYWVFNKDHVIYHTKTYIQKFKKAYTETVKNILRYRKIIYAHLIDSDVGLRLRLFPMRYKRIW